jgi:hypothetical protein
MSECALLALPKELRLAVYETVYPATASPLPVALDDPNQRPSNALLLTCSAIHTGATPIYKQCHQQFWTTTRFQLTLDSLPPEPHIQQALLSIPSSLFARITSLTITVARDGPKNEEAEITLIHNRGGWHAPYYLSSGGQKVDTWRRYRVSTWRETPKHDLVVVKTKAAWDNHANEEELRQSVENHNRTGGVPLRNQLFDLLEMDLVAK